MKAWGVARPDCGCQAQAVFGAAGVQEERARYCAVPLHGAQAAGAPRRGGRTAACSRGCEHTTPFSARVWPFLPVSYCLQPSARRVYVQLSPFWLHTAAHTLYTRPLGIEPDRAPCSAPADRAPVNGRKTLPRPGKQPKIMSETQGSPEIERTPHTVHVTPPPPHAAPAHPRLTTPRLLSFSTFLFHTTQATPCPPSPCPPWPRSRPSWPRPR